MSAPAVEFALLRYVADPARREPRNVGLVVVAGNEVRLRFRGFDGEKVDGKRVRSVVGDLENYRQWIDYIRWQTSREGFELSQILSERAGDSYILDAGGQTVLGDFNVDEMATELFERLVADPAKPAGDRSFEDRVNALLVDAELLGDEHFHVDRGLPVGDVERTFHYVWDNGSLAAGQRVRAGRTNTLDALLFRFQHLRPDCRRVLFVDDFDAAFEQNLREFAEAAHDPKVLGLDSTSDEVREAFTGHA